MKGDEHICEKVCRWHLQGVAQELEWFREGSSKVTLLHMLDRCLEAFLVELFFSWYLEGSYKTDRLNRLLEDWLLAEEVLERFSQS